MAKLKDKIVGYISPKQRKINTLENKVSTLEGVIKDELYNLFIEKLGEPAEMKRLKKDNKRLRQRGHKVYRNDRIKFKEILSKCIKVKEVQNG